MTITVDGKLHIKRYMAGIVPNVAQAIAVGVGNVAESTTHTKLQFESFRSNVELTSLDLVNNRVVYRATLPANLATEIREVGIYSMTLENAAVEPSRLICTFDSTSESWKKLADGSPSSFTSASRVGINAVEQLPAASATLTDNLGLEKLDLSLYAGTDKFVMAYNCANANTASVRWMFMTDTSNYYQFSVGAQTAGYKITEFNKSAAAATGNPNWSNITEIRVSSTAASGGGSHTIFDGIRLNRAVNINPDYVMVAREVLASPYQKENGRVIEIEFSLGITA